MPNQKSQRYQASGSFISSASESLYGRLKVFTKKTAIWARVTGDSGQYVFVPHPAVIPSVTSCLIHAAAQ